MSKSAREIAEDEMRKYIQEHIEHFSKMEQTNVLFGNTPGAWQCETYLDICRLALQALEAQAKPVTVSDEEILRLGLEYSGQEAHYRTRPTLTAPDGEPMKDTNLCDESYVAGFRAAASRNAVARMPSEEDINKEASRYVTLEHTPDSVTKAARLQGFFACYRFILSRLGDAKRGG